MGVNSAITRSNQFPTRCMSRCAITGGNSNYKWLWSEKNILPVLTNCYANIYDRKRQ